MFVHPGMNIQWNTYNSLIGHATPHTQACFRCHNGILRDENDVPITIDCKACHFILADREADPRILDRLGAAVARGSQFARSAPKAVAVKTITPR